MSEAPDVCRFTGAVLVLHPSIGGKRVCIGPWLTAIETADGPAPELRHLCYVLARFMRGNGAEGCWPTTRTIALRNGCHYATVSRRLKELQRLGWLDIEPRKSRFGQVGGCYFPAVPLLQPDATRETEATVAPECNKPTPKSPVAAERPIVAGSAGIVAPGRNGSFRLNFQIEGAAPPSPADAGSAAPNTPGDPPMNPESARARRRALELARTIAAEKATPQGRRRTDDPRVQRRCEAAALAERAQAERKP